jgi:hypothetical protein
MRARRKAINGERCHIRLERQTSTSRQIRWGGHDFAELSNVKYYRPYAGDRADSSAKDG